MEKKVRRLRREQTKVFEKKNKKRAKTPKLHIRKRTGPGGGVFLQEVSTQKNELGEKRGSSEKKKDSYKVQNEGGIPHAKRMMGRGRWGIKETK